MSIEGQLPGPSFEAADLAFVLAPSSCHLLVSVASSGSSNITKTVVHKFSASTLAVI